MRRPFRRASAVVLGTVVVLVVVGVCVRLGLWQLDRLSQRKARNVVIAERMTSPVLELSAAPSDTAGLAYRVAEIVGEYDAAHGVVLAGRSFQGTTGVHLLLPLRLADGSAVLVQRGWLPAVDPARVDPAVYADSGPVQLRGLLLALPEIGGAGAGLAGGGAEVAGGAGAGTGDAGTGGAGGAEADTGDTGSPVAGVDQFRRVWYRLDGAALRAKLPYPVAGLYLQQLPATSPAAGVAVAGSGYPVALPPPELNDGPHLGYAIQWFSFGLIALVGWVVLLVRRESQSNAGGAGERSKARPLPVP